jgi:prolyl-tRNA editing enzyme YbaK/EbsC (Cys-tRNA(Pro) deacylase)
MTSSQGRVLAFLQSKGLEVLLREFDVSTKSSMLAAQALSCTLGEIAKSVVFTAGQKMFVVILSGDRRVDQDKLSQIAGEPVDLAAPDVVKKATGYPIGGVPPFPHRPNVAVLADMSLMRFSQVWTAAGAPNVVFRISIRDLMSTLGGDPVDVSTQAPSSAKGL